MGWDVKTQTSGEQLQRKDKAMSKFRSYNYGGSAMKHHGRKHAKRHADRPPKLQRFCATCGLMDYNVAARMDSAELCVEAAKVVGYNAKGLARDLGNIGKSAFECAEGVLGCATALVRGVIWLFK